MGIFGFLIFIILIAIAARNDDFHIGFAAIFSALFFGVYALGLSADEVLTHFPIKLFLTLVSVTLLFAIADANGTLAIVAERAVLLCRGRIRLIPIMVFALTFFLSALGVGNIAATALMAPTAMVLARKIHLSAFLMSLVVVGGANAASLSPFSLTGVLLAELMLKALPAHGDSEIQYSIVKIFILTFVTISAVHGVGFLVCGGLNWWKRSACSLGGVVAQSSSSPMSLSQRLTFTAVIAFAIGIFLGNSQTLAKILGAKWHEMGSQLVSVSLGLIVVLMASRLVKTDQAISKIPWSTIILVTGVVTYLGVLEEAGAISWASSFIKSSAISVGIVPKLALAAGLLSSISSSSGVVMPLFVPMTPELASHSLNAVALIATICVSAHLVDCSPFSTLGALCLASAKEGKAEGYESLFRNLLIWGLAVIPITVLILSSISFLLGKWF